MYAGVDRGSSFIPLETSRNLALQLQPDIWTIWRGWRGGGGGGGGGSSS